MFGIDWVRLQKYKSIRRSWHHHPHEETCSLNPSPPNSAHRNLHNSVKIINVSFDRIIDFCSVILLPSTQHIARTRRRKCHVFCRDNNELCHMTNSSQFTVSEMRQIFISMRDSYPHNWLVSILLCGRHVKPSNSNPYKSRKSNYRVANGLSKSTRLAEISITYSARYKCSILTLSKYERVLECIRAWCE